MYTERMIIVGDEFMDVIYEYPALTAHLTLFNATVADERFKNNINKSGDGTAELTADAISAYTKEI